MSIWHNDIVFPDDKRYWLAFINVRSNGNTFWKVSCHLADFIEDVSGTGFKVCNTKIEKWCYLDDLFNQQAKIDRLREALTEIARNKTTEEMQGNPDYLDEDGEFIGDFEYAYDEFIKIARKALNGESEE